MEVFPGTHTERKLVSMTIFPRIKDLKKEKHDLQTDYKILFQALWFKTDFALILHSTK